MKNYLIFSYSLIVFLSGIIDSHGFFNFSSNCSLELTNHEEFLKNDLSKLEAQRLIETAKIRGWELKLEKGYSAKYKVELPHSFKLKPEERVTNDVLFYDDAKGDNYYYTCVKSFKLDNELLLERKRSRNTDSNIIFQLHETYGPNEIDLPDYKNGYRDVALKYNCTYVRSNFGKKLTRERSKELESSWEFEDHVNLMILEDLLHSLPICVEK